MVLPSPFCSANGPPISDRFEACGAQASQIAAIARTAIAAIVAAIQIGKAREFWEFRGWVSGMSSPSGHF